MNIKSSRRRGILPKSDMTIMEIRIYAYKLISFRFFVIINLLSSLFITNN
jgi:hypothetical protein